MNKLILIGLLVLACATFEIRQHVEQDINDDRVKVDFYFESLCPYCQQYIVGQLKKAVNTKDFWKICDFNFYPYGNAHRVQNGSSWSFTCQHGPSQCKGNIVESCIARKLDFYSQSLPMLICLETNTSDWNTQGKKCAGQLNIDWNILDKCINSQQGVNLVVQMAKATESLVPAHQYVPWIVINGQHDSKAESAIRSNMVSYVCSIYKGSQKIDACK